MHLLSHDACTAFSPLNPLSLAIPSALAGACSPPCCLLRYFLIHPTCSSSAKTSSRSISGCSPLCLPAAIFLCFISALISGATPCSCSSVYSSGHSGSLLLFLPLPLLASLLTPGVWSHHVSACILLLLSRCTRPSDPASVALHTD